MSGQQHTGSLSKPTSIFGGNYLLNTDGSGTGPVDNPAPGAVGAVLRNPRGTIIETLSESIGPATNVEAEYKALIAGLTLAKGRGITRIRVFVDSELIVDQIQQASEVRADHLRNLHEEATRLLKEFTNYRISWVPRAWNKEADVLATAARIAAAETDGGSSGKASSIPPADAPTVHVEGQAAWIAEHVDVAQEVIEQVLDLEFEFLVGVGIVDDPTYNFRYYSVEELEDAERVVDPERLSRDAERILGIPVDLAAQIFEAEYQFLRMRGLAD